MNPIHWIFFIGTVVLSLCFALYGQWVLWKYAKPSYHTVVTGCEVARFVLDQAGLIHVSVTPLASSEQFSSVEDLFLETRIYEGRDFLSILTAARRAFLKSQLSNMTFWIRLKKRMAFIVTFAVFLGWILLILGNFVTALSFLINLGLGCFTVVMLLALLDMPFELEIETRTSELLRQSGHFQINEYVHLKKLNQAKAFWGLSSIILMPFNQCLCRLRKNGSIYGI